MAQLRDAQTSELILEGPPDELVDTALELGLEEVLFDDVGNIDPAAVKAAADAELEGLQAAASDAPAGPERDRLTARRAKRLERRELARTEHVERARRRMEKARQRASG